MIVYELSQCGDTNSLKINRRRTWSEYEKPCMWMHCRCFSFFPSLAHSLCLISRFLTLSHTLTGSVHPCAAPLLSDSTCLHWVTGSWNDAQCRLTFFEIWLTSRPYCSWEHTQLVYNWTRQNAEGQFVPQASSAFTLLVNSLNAYCSNYSWPGSNVLLRVGNLLSRYLWRCRAFDWKTC